MPSRRRVLASIATSAFVGSTAGCTGPTGSENTTPPAGTTPTDTPASSTTPSTPESTDTPTTQVEDQTKYDQAVVENRTDTAHRVSLAITQDGETLHRGTYDVPPMTGLEVQRRFDWGTHTATASVDGGPERHTTWEHGSCAHTPAPSGNQDLGVVVRADGWEFVVNGCDYLKLGEVYVDQYATASDYRATTSATTTTN